MNKSNKKISFGKDFDGEDKMIDDKKIIEKNRHKAVAKLWGAEDSLEKEEYKKKLQKMNEADLQLACISAGFAARGNRDKLVRLLLKNFQA